MRGISTPQATLDPSVSSQWRCQSADRARWKSSASRELGFSARCKSCSKGRRKMECMAPTQQWQGGDAYQAEAAAWRPRKSTASSWMGLNKLRRLQAPSSSHWLFRPLPRTRMTEVHGAATEHCCELKGPPAKRRAAWSRAKFNGLQHALLLPTCTMRPNARFQLKTE
jgi:hypothetical protein